MTKPHNSARPLDHRGSVAAAFVQGMFAAFSGRGEDPNPLLRGSEIDPACLAGSLARIPLAHYADLYNRVVAHLQDEAFGLFPRAMVPGSFELLCRGLLSAATLAEALQRTARFLRVLLPDASVCLIPQGNEVCLEIRAPSSLPEGWIFAHEWLLRLVHGLSCWLAGRRLTLNRVEFPYPRPGHGADYALIYTADSRFLADGVDAPETPPLRAYFPADLLALPLRRDEAALGRFLQNAPGNIAVLYRRDREMVTLVRDALRDALPHWPGQEDVAASLHLSPRTLHRRLEEEGSSFRAIKEALRRDLAIHRITKTHAPLGQIAQELGFADPSAFYRAFVTWTGSAPSRYRQRSQGAGS